VTDFPVHLLFVDDQWCQLSERSTIVAAFGALKSADPPFEFHYETAEVSPGAFGIEPVLRHLDSLPEPRVVILDILFGEAANRLGLAVLETIRRNHPTLPVLMMTSLGDDLEAVERAMELGANEYLLKRPTPDELLRTLKIYTSADASEADLAIWGNSEAIRHTRALIARVSSGGKASVLITGESGTGKELVARAIHRQGPWRRGPFVDKNCAYESSSLLDSDLFGHEKGAFTGADRRYEGRIERANGGVLFLDEICSMPVELQGKLLRVLETRQFQRIGGYETVRSDFQLVCATNGPLETMLASGQLRPDLYYRIKQFPIHVPPLRERREDIPLLAELFLRRFRRSAGRSYSAERIAPEVLSLLSHYQWPGNVRELRNVVERAVILSRGQFLEEDCLPPEVIAISDGLAMGESGKILVGVRSTPLSENSAEWPRERLLSELCMAVEAKRRIQTYKGRQWKAEFMRLMYPECKARSAKGFNDLLRRLTKGPWGDPDARSDSECEALISELEGAAKKG
jgi:two-component system, NtrC family, response regulator